MQLHDEWSVINQKQFWITQFGNLFVPYDGNYIFEVALNECVHILQFIERYIDIKLDIIWILIEAQQNAQHFENESTWLSANVAIVILAQCLEALSTLKSVIRISLVM